MDLQNLPGLLTAVGTFLGIIGGGIAWLVNRADRKREKREADLIATLKDIIAELKEKVKRLERKLHLLRGTAGKWREQLIAHDITPDPAEWPEDPE